jgi:tetratricopeptide (TPR) repeat protein
VRRRDVRQKFQQSKALFAQKRYPEALILLDELNTLFPNERHIMYARAMCLAELQRPLEAMQICEQAVAMHNDQKSRELLDRLRREHGPLEENPTDLASLTGQTAAGPTPNALPGLPNIPSVPDVPDFPALQPQSSNKRFYIILGSVAGVLLILLIGFPLLASLRKSNESSGIDQTVASEESGIEEDARPSPPAETESPATAEPPATPAASAPKPLQWYYNYEEGKRVASDYDRPLCIFFYDGAERSSALEESVFQDPQIVETLSQFINIRVLYAEDNPAVRQYGIQTVPAIMVQDTYGDTVYSASGDEIALEEFRSALLTIESVEQVTRLAEEALPDFRLTMILLIFLSLLFTPWPLYFTLMFAGKLPYDEFLKDILMVSLVAWGVSAVAGVPCIGFILAIYILHSVYDMGLVDFLIYWALQVVFGAILVAILIGVLGKAVMEYAPMYTG